MKKIFVLMVFLWVMKPCYTLDDVTNYLNTLSQEQAMSAKVIAINSQRSVFGPLNNPYYVWHEA